MRLKDALKFILISACAATTFQITFVTIFASLFRTGFSPESIYLRDLYFFPLTGFACALPTLLFVRKESAPRWEWIVRRILHLLITTGLVFASLLFFGWVSLENIWWGLAFFLIMYTTLSIIGTKRANRLAEQINARISASHDSEDASH